MQMSLCIQAQTRSSNLPASGEKDPVKQRWHDSTPDAPSTD